MIRFTSNALWLGLGFTGGFACQFNTVPTPAQLRNHPTPVDYYLNETFTLDRAIDGDTLDVSDTQNNIFRIRLHGIDTPERGRFYYRQAAAELTAMCKGQKIRLKHIGDGKFERISANVYCGDTFVNTALVATGAAITSIKYADDKNLYALQSKARANCKGVWAKAIDTTYSPKRLTGKSPVKGTVTLTNYKNCTQLTELTP